MPAADRVFIDTNVLLEATVPERTYHRQALQVLEQWPSRGIALFGSGQVLREYLVVATRPREVNGLGLLLADALHNVGQFSNRLHMLDEAGDVRERLLQLVERLGVAGKRIHDANIIATMLAGGVTSLLTLNREDFVVFDEHVTFAEFPESGVSP